MSLPAETNVSVPSALCVLCRVCIWHCRYLVQRVIPMLPRLLCEELCSLHPGYPRFAFSIVWEVDEDGNIYKEWAGRSVISSRAKLAYPMVQQMIEGCFDPAPWGVQLHEGATWEEVRTVLLGGDLSLVMCPMQLFFRAHDLGVGAILALGSSWRSPWCSR